MRLSFRAVSDELNNDKCELQSFLKTCLFHVCICVVDEDHSNSKESGDVLFASVGMNRCKSRWSR